jgi:multiple sugar transport system permease protein
MPFFPLIVPPMFGSATALFFLKGYYDSIPDDLFDAAKIDGLNFIQTYFHLILPIAKPAILSQALLGIVAVFNDYLLPLTYLLDEKDYTLQIALQMCSTGNNTNLPTVMAGSVLSLIPMLILYFSMQKFFVQGLASTGVKG